MSISHVSIALDRISVAPPESPIALFSTDRKDHVNALFANTVTTKRLIAGAPPDLIGVYCMDNDPNEIKRAIRKAAYVHH